jgi:glycosyltransferase involved in cell wall biosynthesis
LIARAPSKWRGHIYFSPQVRQSELVPRIRMHDIAYAGELQTPENKNLTIYNNILLYLQAGLPVVASDTIGHREVADTSANSVRLFASGDSESLANALNAVLSDPDAMWRLREQSKKTADRFFSWDRSKAILLDKVRHALEDAVSHPVGGATFQ